MTWKAQGKPHGRETAPPGTSLHQSGLAFDIDRSKNLSSARALRYLHEHEKELGLIPVPKDYPHFTVGPKAIAAVQQGLKDEGYDVAVDGVAGPQTLEAIARHNTAKTTMTANTRGIYGGEPRDARYFGDIRGKGKELGEPASPNVAPSTFKPADQPAKSGKRSQIERPDWSIKGDARYASGSVAANAATSSGAASSGVPSSPETMPFRDWVMQTRHLTPEERDRMTTRMIEETRARLAREGKLPKRPDWGHG